MLNSDHSLYFEPYPASIGAEVLFFVRAFKYLRIFKMRTRENDKYSIL
jgi:hypothetical protein